MVVVPITFALIVLLLYISNRSWFRVAVVLLAVPFSLIGGFWFLYALGYNMSLAVWVGIIALFGIDAETGQVMLLYLLIVRHSNASSRRVECAIKKTYGPRSTRAP